MGLERTRVLLDALGNPHLRLQCFHIAGTNGKGSVAAILEALLRRGGRRVGKYTSPHLVDFRERITVDGVPVSEDQVCAFIRDHIHLVERSGATFFEATTAFAFEALAAAGTDVAIVETGLGGRLDATNVIEPVAAVVTNVAIDHTEYLGSSLEQIAYEKAGIFKAGAPAVIGERDPALALLLAGHARVARASAVRVAATEMSLGEVRSDLSGTHFALGTGARQRMVSVGLRGAHQAANVATSLLALEAAGPEFAPESAQAVEALASLTLPGRLQIEGRFVFDVAHNPDGIRVLAAALRGLFNRDSVVAVVCVLSDKNWPAMLVTLGEVVRELVLTMAPTAPEGRRWNLALVAAEAERARLCYSVEPDFDAALARAAATGQRVLITGSFHTVGDAMSRLQVSPFSR